MTEKQVLEKAIRKSLANGWNCFGHKGKEGFSWKVLQPLNDEPFVLVQFTEVGLRGKLYRKDYRLEQVLFDLDFVRNLWDLSIWKECLQRIAIAENRLNELESVLGLE